MTAMTLEQIAEIAQTSVMSAEERRAQRISLIMGLRATRSTITREEVERILDEREGRADFRCNPSQSFER